MRNIYLTAGCGLFLALVTSAVLVCSREKRDDSARHVVKRYSRTLAEGVAINIHGIYGIDFVRLGAARIEKLRRGPFTLGAFNQLVLEDLAIVIPEEDPRLAASRRGATAASPHSTPHAVEGQEYANQQESSLELDSDILSLLPDELLLDAANGETFSSLRIDRLLVSRQTGDTTPPLFAAQHASSEAGGLALHGCTLLCDGASNALHSAHLKLTREAMTLVSSTGKFSFPLTPWRTISHFQTAESSNTRKDYSR